MTQQQPSDPQFTTLTKFQRVMLKYPLYVKLAFGALVMFGVVGQMFAGGTKPMLILVMTALMWTMLKIMNEATDALNILHRMKKSELEEASNVAPPSDPFDDGPAT
jgi:hypothetical protein